jgi:hypothetical protein
VLREVLVYPTLPFNPPTHVGVAASANAAARPLPVYLPLYYEALSVAADLYIPVHGNPHVVSEYIFKDMLEV